MEKKVLFLDFDGVLFDTLKEVYLVNRCLYSKTDIFEEVDEDNYKLYSKYKFLVYNIWMFYYYNPLVFNNTQENEIIGKYFNLLKNRDLKKEEDFCIEFLNVRKNLVENHYDFWKSLEVPYEFFFEIKKLYEENDIEIVVASKKNKTSIMERFESYGFKLSENKVFAREALDKYSSKGEFIEEYMKKNNIKSAVFVDDNNNNLKTTQNNPNVKNILALWGNTEPNSVGYNQKQAVFEIKNYFKSR